MTDSDAWAVFFIIFFALFLGLMILFLKGSSVGMRRAGFFTGIGVLLLAASCLSFSLSQRKDYMRADKAVIVRPVTSVKSSPSGESSKDLFVLHEGTKVKVLDQVGNWNNIELADGRQGWIPSSDIELI